MKNKILSFLILSMFLPSVLFADATTASRVRNFVNDKNAGTPITASYMDSEFDNVITKLNSKVIAASSAPSSPTSGDTWVDTTNYQVKYYNGTTWIVAGQAVYLTNQSGSTRSAGDVVVVDSSNNSSFTTTTTAGNESVFGVVLESISNTSSGMVQVSGVCAALTVDGSTTKGQFLKTSGTAAKATPVTSAVSGVFAVALTASATSVVAILTGVAHSNGGQPALGSFRNLKVTRPSASTVTVTADRVILEDSSTNTVRVASVSETADITASGANGLDTGAEASGTWYYIWIIRKSSDGTQDSLLSTSSSSPTMPSGYDQKALVSAVRNDGSSNFVDFVQYGMEYWYTTWQTAASGNVGSTWTAITTTAYVPSALSEVTFGAIVGAGAIGISNKNTVGNIGTVSADQRAETSSTDDTQMWQFSILTANTLYWQSNNAGSTVLIGGFKITKLN